MIELSRATFDEAFDSYVIEGTRKAFIQGVSVNVCVKSRTAFNANKETIIQEVNNRLGNGQRLEDVIVQKDRLVPVMVTK